MVLEIQVVVDAV